MSFANLSQIPRSLAFRLTAQFAFFCGLALAVIFAGYYVYLRAGLSTTLDQSLRAEVGEYSALLRSRGLSVLSEVLEREAVSEGTDRMFFRLVKPDGTVIYQSDMRAWPGYTVPPFALREAAAGKITIDTFLQDATPPRTRVMTGAISDEINLQMGMSTHEMEAILRSYRQLVGSSLLVIVVGTTLGGWIILRRALRRVNNVTHAATAIAQGDMSQRVVVEGRPDEIYELASAFNRMIEHNESLIRHLREVTDDIAHDLRSPLTRIRGTAEIGLAEFGAHTAEATVLGSIVEECDKLLKLINTMLEISETEAGLARLSPTEFDLGALVRDVCEFFQPAAEDKGVEVSVLADETLPYRGDAPRLHRAIAQLLDNAVKYTAPGGTIGITCAMAGTSCRISVKDTGAGIAPEHIQSIFSRFYRADESRSQPGNGMGLNLAQAIVKAHGGTISVQSAYGKGSTFEIVLPMP